MRKVFECSECRTEVRTSSVVKSASCQRCGEKFYTDGEPRKMYPSLSMHPIDYVAPDGFGAVSMWMLGHTRPVRMGYYECRFRHIEPAVLTLFWDGRQFWSMQGQRQLIAMTHFLTWRGMYA